MLKIELFDYLSQRQHSMVSLLSCSQRWDFGWLSISERLPHFLDQKLKSIWQKGCEMCHLDHKMWYERVLRSESLELTASNGFKERFDICSCGCAMSYIELILNFEQITNNILNNKI